MSKPPPHPNPNPNPNPNPSPSQPINPSTYTHSPAHYYVATHNHTSLSHLLSTLPQPDPTHPTPEPEPESIIDRRDDIPYRETPLHLAVRLNDVVSVQLLANAGADVSLQNSMGWNPLQDAVCRRKVEVARILAQHHHLNAWFKWRRRLPLVVAALRNMRDFYLEIHFSFESSFLPFVAKLAPSDTYRIWKRDGNLRADTTLAGFDGMKIQRADQSFLFLGEGGEDSDRKLPEGSLIVLNRDDKKIFDAFENAGTPMSEEEVTAFCSQTSVYRPGMDVTKAELVPRLNWRRQEKVESVGEWKAKVYDVHNVVFSFRSRKVNGRDEQVLPLELDEEDDFLVAENFRFSGGGGSGGCGGDVEEKRRHSSFVREEREWVTVGRKSVDINFSSPPKKAVAERRRASSVCVSDNVRGAEVAAERRRASSVCVSDNVRGAEVAAERRRGCNVTVANMVEGAEVKAKEKEYVKSLRPTVWLTEDFPLKTEEVLPLLDILANKVKAVRRLREVLTTKFPPGNFPVKIAIPVVPTVRVVITFTKFIELQPTECFYTPLSSPRFLSNGNCPSPSNERDSRATSAPSSSSWLRRSNSTRLSGKSGQNRMCPEALISDPFEIPSGYSWESIDSKSNRKGKRSKVVRKAK